MIFQKIAILAEQTVFRLERHLSSSRLLRHFYSKFEKMYNRHKPSWTGILGWTNYPLFPSCLIQPTAFKFVLSASYMVKDAPLSTSSMPKEWFGEASSKVNNGKGKEKANGACILIKIPFRWDPVLAFSPRDFVSFYTAFCLRYPCCKATITPGFSPGRCVVPSINQPSYHPLHLCTSRECWGPPELPSFHFFGHSISSMLVNLPNTSVRITFVGSASLTVDRQGQTIGTVDQM